MKQVLSSLDNWWACALTSSTCVSSCGTISLAVVVKGLVDIYARTLYSMGFTLMLTLE